MSIRRPTLLLILLVLAGCGTGGGSTDEGAGLRDVIPHISLPHWLGGEAKGGVYRGSLEKTVFAGRPAQLWGDTSLGRDCTPFGETLLEVARPGLHGATVIRDGELYAVYPEGSERAYCSGRLVTGVLAFYTAQAGYSGPDQVVLRGTTADGEVREVTVNITVKPAPPLIRSPTASRRAAAPAALIPASPPPLLIPLPTRKPVPTDPDAPLPTAPQS